MSGRLPLPAIALGAGCALLGGAMGWGFEAWRTGRSATDAAGVEAALVAHPEILTRAAEALRAREDGDRLAAVSDRVQASFPGAVLGNPQGKTVLVEFTDYACTYCRRSVADVAALVAAHPDLKVVMRELPILTPESADAAKMALAAAEQGKYAAFHEAMFALGRPDAATIAEAARRAGLDLARAQKVAADPRTEAELAGNLDIARRLGFTGTPSWVAGKRILSGAVGPDALAEAIAASRG